MWLVVGLGNPGQEYEGTRHNVGFEVVDRLAERHRLPATKRLGGALVGRGSIGGCEVVLAKPTTYMNLSGDAVGAVAHFFKIESSELLVVHDELDFEPGQVRVKAGGGHGGHNGLRSIVAHMGRDFTRVRVGIGKPAHATQGADYVLSTFDRAARREVDIAVEEAADAVETVLERGVQAAMNRYNRRAAGEEEKEDEGD